MNFSKKNHEHKNTDIFSVSKIFKPQISSFVKLFLICFVLSTFIISCNDPKKPDQENIDHGAVVHDKLITIEQAVKMYGLYSDMRINVTRDTLQSLYGDEFKDTRMVWFDLDTLKSYIAFVEEKSAKNHITPEGIQFYFSVYPDDEKFGDDKNHQTFFIAPTTKNNDVQSGYTLKSEGDKEQVVFLKNVLNNREYRASQNPKVDKASFFTKIASSHTGGLLLNRGGGTPPGGNDEQ